MVFITVDKVSIIFLKKNKMIQSKSFSVSVPYRAMIAKWTKEANKENQRDGINGTTDSLR